MTEVRKVLVINGHPDPDSAHFAAALSAAYLRGANDAGHQIRRIDIGSLDLPAMTNQAAFVGEPSPAAWEVQQAILWADHLVVVYPLWLGGLPAALKAFFEQVFRYGFAISAPGGPPRGLLKGRTARVVVTMGMPTPFFRLVFDSAGLRALTRGILGLSGFRVRSTVIGNVEGPAPGRARWLRRLERLGADAI